MLIIGTIHLRKLVLTVMLAVVVVTVIMLSNLDLVVPLFDRFGALDENVLNRIAWLKNPFFSDSAYRERLDVGEHTWQMFLDSPLLGNGTGASKEWNPWGISSHNMFLNFMADHGILGFFILPLLLLAVTWRAAGESRHMAIIFSVFILLWSLVSHNVLEERYILLSFGLITVMATKSRMKQGDEEVDKVKIQSFRN
jgi:O-antigen ligase